VVTDADVLANAQAACQEIRTQLDHQIRTADSIDTKAWALVTVTGVVSGLIAPRLQLDDPERGIPAIIVFLVVMTLVACSILAIRPKADFSFGAEPTALVAELENYVEVSFALGLGEALATARQMNVRALDRKRAWYTRALLALAGSLVGIAWLVYIGAIRG
jgi:hypothetical protein